MGKNWQCLIRIQHHPKLSKTFKKHEDAKRWANETELKIRREDGGIAKIKFASFKISFCKIRNLKWVLVISK